MEPPAPADGVLDRPRLPSVLPISTHAGPVPDPNRRRALPTS